MREVVNVNGKDLVFDFGTAPEGWHPESDMDALASDWLAFGNADYHTLLAAMRSHDPACMKDYEERGPLWHAFYARAMGNLGYTLSSTRPVDHDFEEEAARVAHW